MVKALLEFHLGGQLPPGKWEEGKARSRKEKRKGKV